MSVRKNVVMVMVASATVVLGTVAAASAATAAPAHESGVVMTKVGMSATAPNCQSEGKVTVRGEAEARWTKCIGDGWTSVDGWVRDTGADGKCAEVFARFANGAEKNSNRACPEGEVERFGWKESGSGVSVFLRTVPTG